MKIFNLIVSHKFMYFTIIYFFSIISILQIKYHYLRKNIFDISLKKDFIILSINLSIGIVTVIFHSVMLARYINFLSTSTLILNIMSLFTYISVSTYNLCNNLNLLLKTKERIATLESYNKNLHDIQDGIKGFKHDFDNIVTTIGGYVNTHDMEGLKKYYQQLNSDCQRLNNLTLLNPTLINNAGIYNLLNQKYQIANEKNIKINLSFMLDLNSLHMQIYEFARILGILLDNAIDASSRSDEKIINLTFKNDYKSSRQIVIIENSYSDKNIDVKKIFEKGVSFKENHTGLGLWNIQQILKKHNNINLFTYKDDKFFSQQLEIYG